MDHWKYITDTKTHKKLHEGDKVKVIGEPERFFYDSEVIITSGIIKEINWYNDDEDFGFMLDTLNGCVDKFYLPNVSEIFRIP